MNTGEKNISPYSALGPQPAKSNAGLGLGLERQPSGRRAKEAFPAASRPSAQLVWGRLVWGPPPPSVPWELVGVGGSARLPLPGQLLQNLPAAAFQPLLKGQWLLPNCLSKAL